MSRESDELRRKVLDASVALVAEQGVRAVSFREVARRAGVSHQAPYHHFGNYLGILRAIAQEGFATLAAAMRDAAAKASDPVAALEAAGVAYVRFARTHVGHFRVMFQSTLVDVNDARTPLSEAEATYGTLVSLATAAHRAGGGEPLPVEALAHLSWSVVHGLSMLLIEGTLAAKNKRHEPMDDAAVIRQVVGGFRRLLAPAARADGRK